MLIKDEVLSRVLVKVDICDGFLFSLNANLFNQFISDKYIIENSGMDFQFLNLITRKKVIKNKRVGIVSYWFNRGQGTVGRYIRSIFQNLGYETFVLARPTQDHFDLSRFVASGDVWDQEGVTAASNFNIPEKEYLTWAKKNSLDVVFFDQNYQFDEIAKLKRLGIKTVGRFVWESFGGDHVEPAKKAFDIIYSLTKCEQVRYGIFGIDSPRVQWGCHPELTSFPTTKRSDKVYFFYPGGYLSKRKPTSATIDAFSSVDNPDIRLVLKVQTKRRYEDHFGKLGSLDPRIQIVSDDIPAKEYYELFSSCHVCLAPSRWEGLGLHLYEAIAFGMPIITNDCPPMNEMTFDQFSGKLVKSIVCGNAQSGIFAFDPEHNDLASAISTLSNTDVLRRMTEAVKEVEKIYSWENTVKGYQDLLDL